MRKNKGWQKDSRRHALASKGIKTTHHTQTHLHDSSFNPKQHILNAQGKEMKTYNGFPLFYEGTAVMYDLDGEDAIGTIDYGRDTNGAICVNDGIFVRNARSSDGNTLHIYETHQGTVAIKRRDGKIDGA